MQSDATGGSWKPIDRIAEPPRWKTLLGELCSAASRGPIHHGRLAQALPMMSTNANANRPVNVSIHSETESRTSLESDTIPSMKKNDTMNDNTRL